MKLAHFTPQPIIQVNSIPLRLRTGMSMDVDVKPKGFWVTDMDCEDNWWNWCHQENFRTQNLRYQQDITLSPYHKVLVLHSAQELDDFTNTYGEEPFKEKDIGMKFINWKRFCAEYQGIIITPYIWARRNTEHTFWYWGWDCASGCIWDARAIDHISVVISIPQTGKVA